MDFRNAVILVTGGGTGSGLELARRFESMGAQVYICGCRQEPLDAASQAHNLKAIMADITKAEDQKRLLEDIRRTHGRLDLLVNNAAILGAYDFAEAPTEDAVRRIESEISINATAPLTLISRALALHRASQNPAVLLIGSSVAYVPIAGTPIYFGTKAVIHHAAAALSHQLAPLGISVIEALPPVIDTDMGQRLKAGNLKKMTPADLVNAILSGMQAGQREIVMGQAKQLRPMARIAPNYLFSQMAKTEFH